MPVSSTPGREQFKLLTVTDRTDRREDGTWAGRHACLAVCGLQPPWGGGGVGQFMYV